MTRAELPDIRQPLEILSDEIARQAAASPLRRVANRRRRVRPRRRPRARRGAQGIRGQVQGAQSAAALLHHDGRARRLRASARSGYFWYQLRPPAPLVNANPRRRAAEQVAAPEPRPAAPAALAAAPGRDSRLARGRADARARSAGDQAGIRSAEPRPGRRPNRAVAAPTRRAGAAPPRRRTPRPQTAPAAPQRASEGRSGVRRLPRRRPAAARADYQAALRDESGNRDALLGLAAIDVRTGRFESAEARYLRLLQVDPRDPHAQAALIALRGEPPRSARHRKPRQEPARRRSGRRRAATSRSATSSPSRAAGRRRSSAYFKAFAADPENADFAYNLAVSLDHLRQAKLALEYYRRAIALAEKRGASFDVAGRTQPRVAQLGQLAMNSPANPAGEAAYRPDPDRPGDPHRGPAAHRAARADQVARAGRAAAGAARLRVRGDAARRAVREARPAVGRPRRTSSSTRPRSRCCRATWRGATACSRWRSTGSRRSSSSRSPTPTTSSRSTSCARTSRASCEVELRLAGESEIERAIEHYYGHEFSIDGILREIETGEIDYATARARATNTRSRWCG